MVRINIELIHNHAEPEEPIVINVSARGDSETQACTHETHFADVITEFLDKVFSSHEDSLVLILTPQQTERMDKLLKAHGGAFDLHELDVTKATINSQLPKGEVSH